VTDALLFLENQNHAPQSWDDLQSLQQCTISVVCKQDLVISGEARLATRSVQHVLYSLDWSTQEECKLTPHVLAGILEAALDPLFQVNAQGIIQMARTRLLQHNLDGHERNLWGRNISMIVEAEHVSNHDAYVQHYLTTGERKSHGKQTRITRSQKGWV